jgi:dynamin-binding protein
VRKRVIEPIEQIIAAYGPPGLAMKKRSKRRLDYERYLLAKSQGKKIDEKLSELVDQYEALNETLKMELPKLYAGSQKIGNICLVQFLAIQTEWYSIWQDKVRVVLEESQLPKDVSDIVDMFNRDYKYVQARAQELGICNGTIVDDGTKTRASSQSTMKDDDASTKSKPRPSNLSSRDRGLSMTSDKSPSLPTPDFAKRHSGQFTFSPIVTSAPGIGIGLPQFAYQAQPSTNGGHSRAGSGSPATPDTSFGSRPHASNHTRPSTSRSYTSDNGMPRISTDYNNQHRRESSSKYNSATHHVDGPLSSGRPYSGLFHSAMPLPDGPEDSQRSSRASSRDRNVSGGYNVLYLAASLFEFNISATKSEAGYPYLTYQAGEVSYHPHVQSRISILT